MEKIKIIHVFEDGFKKTKLYKQQVAFLEKYHNSSKTKNMRIRQFDFDMEKRKVYIPDLQMAKLGTNTLGKSAYGADDVKRHVRLAVKAGECDLVVFWYDAKPMVGRNSYVAAFKYANDLYPGTPMIQIPDTERNKYTLAHEFAHAYRKLLVNPPNKDFLDLTPVIVEGTIKWIPYYKNNNPYFKGGNFQLTWILFSRHTRRYDFSSQPVVAVKELIAVPIKPVEARSMDFERAVEFVLKHEGGYVNHPKDPGGETNFGISKRSYPNVNIKKLTRDKVKDIYYRDFWLKAKCDKLDGAVALMVFDLAVNAGVKRSAIILQRALGVKEDGVIGSKTIAAINKAGSGLPFAFAKHRQYFYQSLKNFGTFGKGWSKRTLDALQESLK